MQMRVVVLLALLPSALLAQDDARGDVGGVVYDSVARRPIGGATVQLVSAVTPGSGARSAQTDAEGRYEIQDIPVGRYVIGFQHVALDTLALEAPARAIEIRAGQRTRADLAVPSPRRIVAAMCRATPTDSIGLLLGVLRDATTGAILDAGRVDARWSEIVIDASGITTDERMDTSAVNADGWFGLCVPHGPGVALRGIHGADSSGFQLVPVPPNGVARHDLYVGGTAVVRGTVTSDRDRPIANARVGFGGMPRFVFTDSAGAFVLQGPAGTQSVEVRAIGHSPERRAVRLRAGSDTTIAMRLVSIQRVLDTIRVVAERLYYTDPDGFEQRKRSAGGRFWDAATFRERGYLDAVQPLMEAPSIRITTSPNGFQRIITMRGGLFGRCIPDFWLNGMLMPSDLLGELDILARPHEITGMELYTSGTVPVQFTNRQGCGAIVVWTRAQPRRRR